MKSGRPASQPGRSNKGTATEVGATAPGLGAGCSELVDNRTIKEATHVLEPPERQERDRHTHGTVKIKVLLFIYSTVITKSSASAFHVLLCPLTKHISLLSFLLPTPSLFFFSLTLPQSMWLLRCLSICSLDRPCRPGRHFDCRASNYCYYLCIWAKWQDLTFIVQEATGNQQR